MFPLTAGCYLKKWQWEIQSRITRDSRCQDSIHMQQSEENSLFWKPRNREVQVSMWGDLWFYSEISLSALFFTIKIEFCFWLHILSTIVHFHLRYLPGYLCSYLPPMVPNSCSVPLCRVIKHQQKISFC